MRTPNLTQFLQKHSAEVERIRTELASNFDAPAQRIINAGFTRIGEDRFTKAGDDVWEMVSCYLNGWEYERPSEELITRWGRY